MIRHIIRNIATLPDTTDPTEYSENIFYVMTSSRKREKREAISESERAPSKPYREKVISKKLNISTIHGKAKI